MSDMISRQAALDAVIRFSTNEGREAVCTELYSEICSLPPAQPERKTDGDLISRQAAIDALHMHLMYRMGTDSNKKRLDDWINSLPSAQETHEERTETHACDLISRQAAIDAYGDWYVEEGTEEGFIGTVKQLLEGLPPAQPEIIRCTECKHYREYDSEYVENAVVVQCMADRYPTSEAIPDGWFCAGAERKDDE